MTDNTRNHERLSEEERKTVFGKFNEKRSKENHDLWEAQRFRAQLNSKETTGIFDEWVAGGSGTYEQDVLTLGYTGPAITSRYLTKYIPNNKNKARIIDVGAGSGLSGLALKEAGYTDVDWLDPSEQSVPPAKARNCYNKFYIEYLTAKPLDTGPDTYDALTCVGAFFEGLVPLEAFGEMIRIVKPGGYVIISISCTSLETCKEYKGRLEPRIMELCDQKEWELVERVKEPNYLKDVPAMFYVLRVLRRG